MTPFAAMLVCFVLLVALSCPLSFSMLLSCALYLVLSGNSLTLLVQQLFSGLDIFTIMAIPFFMLAGDLMVASGTADRLLRFAQLLVGRLRGGTGYVNIVASMLFGGCSGSAIADIAALGRTQVSMMEKSGFSRDFSAALTIATSIKGAIIPPSIPLVLVGAVSGTSIGGMLVGGLVPGLLVGVTFAVAVYWTTRHTALSSGEALSRASEAAHCRRGDSLPDDAGHHSGRDPVGCLHAHRGVGRRRRLGVRPVGHRAQGPAGPSRVLHDPAAQRHPVRGGSASHGRGERLLVDPGDRAGSRADRDAGVLAHRRTHAHPADHHGVSSCVGHRDGHVAGHLHRHSGPDAACREDRRRSGAFRCDLHVQSRDRPDHAALWNRALHRFDRAGNADRTGSCRNIFPFFCAAVLVLLLITYVPETVLVLPRALGLL